MKLVAGIDNGTQSTKVIIYDYDSRKIAAVASSSHELLTGSDGTREQQASWWIDALKACFDQIDVDLKKNITAIGVSGQQHGFVPVAEDGEVLNNVKLWCDTSTVKEANSIMENYGGRDKIIKDAGNPIAVGYTASKILWFKDTHPDLYKKMKYVMLPHDYLNFYLTGAVFTEFGDASGTGYLDVSTRSWNKDILKAIDPSGDLEDKIPVLIEPNAVGGLVSKKAAAEFGLTAGIPVSSGGGDNMMSAIGSGIVSEGRIVVSLGTSGTLFGFSEKPIIDEESRLAAFCSSSGGWLPLLCTMNCTVGTEIYRDLFDLSVKELDDLAAESLPGAEGLITIPFFNGERSPDLPKGKGCLVGMTADNVNQANILRSAMEAAIYGIKMGLDAFVEKGFKPEEVYLVGGGANSPLWKQIAADILELPVRLTPTKETAAYGSAMQALWMLKEKEGVSMKLAEVLSTYGMEENGACIRPEVSSQERYRMVYEQYKLYVSTLTKIYR